VIPRVLSLRQPWAWAVMHAGKRIENRRWDTRYRGPVLIHAAKAWSQSYEAGAFGWMLDEGCVAEIPDGPLRLGGIVGRARIVDVIDPEGNTAGVCRRHGIDGRWHMRDQFGFVLADVEPLPFTPCRAYLGLFGADRVLPPEAVSALMRAT
jgi:hypothetical protein